MSITQKTLDLSAQGHNGAITCIPTGIPKYDEYLYGIRQGTLINFLAETSVGKTSFSRDVYFHRAYEYFKQINNPELIDIELVDYSLEISPEINTAGAIIRKAFVDYQQVISLAQFFKWGDNRLSEDQARLVNSYKEYFEEFENKLKVYDGEVSPTYFHDTMMEVAKRNGTFEREGRWISECGKYTPHNPKKFVIVLFDTVNIAETDSGHTTAKSSIDRISRLSVLFRNRCNFTIILLQQISAEIASTDRARFGITTPILRDAEDSRRPGKDANIVLALYDPLRHLKDDQTTFKGYNMDILRNWIKTLHILKHREGVINKFIPLKSHGVIPYYEQLPEANQMTEQDYVLSTRH